MSNCVCGRTTRPPMCDRSCGLTEQQYLERTQRLAKLYNNTQAMHVNNTKKPADKNEQSQ